ncbi:MAG TPA: AMP-binding protein, partial [Woeseiaceae bacterium]|nr:AMP-binding protein [Woeseiaceae bacterium]
MNDNIAQMIEVRARQLGSKPALSLYGGDPAEQYSYEALDRASRRLAGGFIGAGVRPDDRIALLCDSRPRFAVAMFATLRAGAVVLPLDARQSVDELARILADARPRILLAGRAQEALAAELLAARGQELTVLSLESAADESRDGLVRAKQDARADESRHGLARAKQDARADATAWPSMDTLSPAAGHRCVPRTLDDAAVLTYTSGTTGSAKGVVTTSGNLLFQIRAIRAVMQNDERVTSVSILPLSHLFELTAGFLAVLYGGGHICYCNSLLPVEVISAMRAHRVTCMAVVPLFLKLIRTAICNEVAHRSAWRWRLFAVMTRLTRLLPLSVRRRLYSPLHRRFGGALEYFVCGGAPLDADTERFFAGVGIPVYQGYGLAETSPIIATNSPRAVRAGSVGKPLPGVEVRVSVADGGEILTRGPHVMRGYFGNRELTTNLVDADGWLHTGDIGRLDRHGFLYVSGRRKNTIVLGSGQKVQPEELEALLFDHPDIREGCIIGMPATRGIEQGSEEVCAIAVASDSAVSRFAGHLEQLEPALRSIVRQRALGLPAFKRPTRIIVCSDPLPRTSTRKVRRPA